MSKKPPMQMLDGYRIAVTGRNIQITDSMKDYAIEKISKIERFTDRIIEVFIIMDIQRIENHVEIIMKVEQLKIVSHANSTDMYVSIDQAVDKIETQLKRYKSRIRQHQARPHYDIEMEVNVYKAPSEEETLDINDEIERANHEELMAAFQPHKVIATETYPLKTLSLDEAIMKMELSQDHFLVFRGEDDQKLKVIYRRGDMNYNIIKLEAEYLNKKN